MGTPVPPPVIVPPVGAGDPCSLCWGPGKPFGDGDTPNRIIVSISGINKGRFWTPGRGEPVNGVFDLLQKPTVPCSFDFLDAEIGIGYFILFPDVLFSARNSTLNTIFSGEIDGQCRTQFSNQLTTFFVGGTAVITIPELE